MRQVPGALPVSRRRLPGDGEPGPPRVSVPHARCALPDPLGLCSLPPAPCLALSCPGLGPRLPADLHLLWPRPGHPTLYLPTPSGISGLGHTPSLHLVQNEHLGSPSHAGRQPVVTLDSLLSLVTSSEREDPPFFLGANRSRTPPASPPPRLSCLPNSPLRPAWLFLCDLSPGCL